MLCLEGHVGLHRLFNFSFFPLVIGVIGVIVLDYCDIEWFALEMNRDHSVFFEIASNYCISDSFFDHDRYSVSSEPFLPTVVDIMVIELNSPIPVHFSSLIPENVDIHSCHLLFDHFQFALIHGPNIPVPMQYCSLQHQTLLLSPVASTALYSFCFGSIPSFFLELFLH